MTGTYTIVQLQRQDELTYAIRGRIAEAQKKQEEKGNKQASDHIRDGMAMDWSRRLVEKGHRLGTGGHIINFLSAAFNVADRMDLLPQIRYKDSHSRRNYVRQALCSIVSAEWSRACVTLTASQGPSRAIMGWSMPEFK
jgi:hypothetical protein